MNDSELFGVLLEEAKAGARNSARDAERLQRIHDFSVANGAACAMGSKAGARNNAEDMARLQEIHDLCVENGALCAVMTKAIPSPQARDYLVVEDPEKSSTWHLQVSENGTPNHNLMGAAWAALFNPNGFRGNKYAGPSISEAKRKLKDLYASEEMDMPDETKTIVEAVGMNYRASSARNCTQCQFYQMIEGTDEAFCNKWKIETDCEYICDAWAQIQPAELEVTPLEVSVTNPEALAEIIMGSQNMDEMAKAVAVKFVDGSEDTLQGYEVMWGDAEHPDLSAQKDYFTKATDFWAQRFPNPRPLAYHHGFDEGTKDAPVVGTIIEGGADEIGRWVKMQLDKSHKYYEGIRQLVAAGKLKMSSDSIPQYVRRERQANGTNWVKTWPLPLSSLTPTPAEPRMWEVAQLKSAYKSLGIALTLPEEGAEAGDSAPSSSAGSNHAENILGSGTKSQGETEMTEQEILALLDKRETEAKAAQEAKAAADAQIEARAQAIAEAKLAEMAKHQRPSLFSAKGGSRVDVASKYDGMSVADLSFLATLRAEAKMQPDEEVLRALAAKSYKAIEAGNLDASAMEDCAVKSNEVMQSTLASYGDEWVPSNYGTQLWNVVRAKARLLQGGFIPQQEIPKGYESDTIPLESSTDFTFYNVTQAATVDSTMKTVPATITSSQMGTGSRVITVGKVGARGLISGELDEDSIIDAIPEARAKLERQLPAELDFLLFNMDDTAATDNINGNGTPVTTSDYAIGKGIIRNALKNASGANATDWSAAPTTARMITLYNLMGADGYMVWDDPTMVKGFCDYQTWAKLMGMSDLLTVANAGPDATIRNGVAPDGGIPVLGVRWYPTAGVRKAQATGVRHGTEAGNNVYGRAVLVRGDQWKMRWKRRPKFETTRVALSDLTEIVVTMRFGIGYLDTEASCIAYNASA